MDDLRVHDPLTGRWMLRVAAVLSIVALGGCRASTDLPSTAAPVPATATPLASPGSSGGVDPSTLTEPSAPSATTDDGGARVTIELDRNPMPVEQATWITTTVANIGRDRIFWSSDCDAAVWVCGPVVGAPWRSGLAESEPFSTWKAFVLDQRAIGGTDRIVQFEPELFVDGGSAACSEVAHVHELKAGETLVQRARWDGLAFDGLSPPPTGVADLVGRFVYGRSDDSTRTSTIEIHLRAGLLGRPDRLLDPAEAVDIAIRDAGLSALLEARELRNGNEGVIRFDPSTGGYVIGVADSANVLVPRLHGVVVDARTGAIVGRVERIWDPSIDGT